MQNVGFGLWFGGRKAPHPLVRQLAEKRGQGVKGVR